jgi:hypothetical protein
MVLLIVGFIRLRLIVSPFPSLVTMVHHSTGYLFLANGSESRMSDFDLAVSAFCLF